MRARPISLVLPDEEDRNLDLWGFLSPGRLSSKGDERCRSPKSPWPSLLGETPNARRKDRSVSQPSAAIARAMQSLSAPQTAGSASATALRRSSSGTLQNSNRSAAILELPSVRPPTSPGGPGSPESGARRASFSDYEDACARLGVLPKFARAVQERRCRESLELSGLGFGDLQLQAMLCDRHLLPLGILSRWRLRDARLTGPGVEALVSKLPVHTEMMDLSHTDIGLKGISAMANRFQKKLLPQLRWLDLSMNGLRDVAIAPLTASLLFCPLLIRLELNHNHIEEGQALGDLLSEHPRLARLSLHGNALGEKGGAKVFQGLAENARNGGHLSDLDLAWNQLDGSDAAMALAEVLRISVTLYHLDLSYNNLGPASCQIIADGLRDNHFLYGLHIVGNAATMDADGFLTPVIDSPKASSLPTGDKPQAQQFGDLRQGIDGRLGARSTDASGLGVGAWTDADVLRERDVLEQQTTCWACEGWERLELQWRVETGSPTPKAVWAFTSIDGFRAGLRLKRVEGATPAVFAAARMVPRDGKILAIFQVDSELRTCRHCDLERLPLPVEIELRACEELPVLQPEEVVRTELVNVGGEFEHHLILRMETASVISRSSEAGRSSGRSVLLDGPAGPVQMPRVTESEFRMRTKVPRGLPFYADYQRESPKLMEECFLLDWSRAKVARIVGKASEKDRKSTEEVVLAHYRRVVALFRELSVSGNDAGFGGVTQLEASALLMQAGLVDDVTRVADIDRCFIAAKVLPFDLRKAGANGTLGDKVLSRHQFLEMLLRVADQRYVQTGKCKSMCSAVASVMKSLAAVADAKVSELDGFQDAFHTDEVDDVIKKHHGILQEVYRRYSGHVAPPGAARFMSFGEFQDLLEAAKAYNNDFVPRRCGLAFRLGMMTQADEVFRSRFQEMSFLEFQHAVGVMAWMRSGGLTTALSEAVDSFIVQKLSPLSRRNLLRGASSFAGEFRGKANIAMTPTAFRGSMLRDV